MHAGKALLMFLGLVLVVALGAAGVMFLMPSVRPGFVQGWFNRPASSPTDAMDKFKQAIDKRDYRAASLYLSAGEYKEWFDKAQPNAEALGHEIDNLRSALEGHKVKSDKGQFVLCLIDPFPSGFKTDVKTSGDTATATLSWADEPRFSSQHAAGVADWRVNNLIHNSLLPSPAYKGAIRVDLEKEGGSWKIKFPTVGSRKIGESAAFVRDNGGNFRNALQGLKNDVKNDPQTKEAFETSLKVKLEESK